MSAEEGRGEREGRRRGGVGARKRRSEKDRPGKEEGWVPERFRGERETEKER
jgi:hypothetical protein